MDGHTAAATLGVGPQATKDEIRRAFRARVKRVHPDVAAHSRAGHTGAGGTGAGPGPGQERPGSSDAFLALRAAFDLLVAAAPEIGVSPSRNAEASGPAAVCWSLGAVPAPRATVIDVVDIPRPAPNHTPAPRRAMSFDDHLAAALTAMG